MESAEKIDQYIERVRAKDYIKSYIDTGLSHETAIRQGWVEAYEELFEMCLKLRDRINILEKNIKN
tara:strand:+ start:480 stop:677 length:198 start_codon:yes stop_codon:yes gene_type:complete